MITQIQQELRRTQVYATAAGEALLEEREDIAPIIADSIRIFSERSSAKADYERINSGNFSTIYGLPGHDDVCVKVSDPTQSKAAWKKGVALRKGEDLVTQMRFLDLLQVRLQETDKRLHHKVAVPTQLIASKNAQNIYISFQERIDPNFVPVRQYFGSLKEPDEVLGTQKFAKHLHGRIFRAVGNCLLERCLDDVHMGNVLVDNREKSAEDSKVYLIDMPHSRKRTARAILRFSGVFVR